MRSFFLASIVALAIGCAHQQTSLTASATPVPAVPVYAVVGSMQGDAPMIGTEMHLYRSATAVPIAEHLLVTSSLLFGRDYRAEKGFWGYDVCVGTEHETMLDNPVYDEKTGLVFIKTRRAYKPAPVRTGPYAAGEHFIIAGYTFSRTDQSIWLEPKATTSAARATLYPGPTYLSFSLVETPFRSMGAGVYDVDGRLTGILLLGDEKIQVALPISTVLEAMHRVIK